MEKGANEISNILLNSGKEDNWQSDYKLGISIRWYMRAKPDNYHLVEINSKPNDCFVAS